MLSNDQLGVEIKPHGAVRRRSVNSPGKHKNAHHPNLNPVVRAGLEKIDKYIQKDVCQASGIGERTMLQWRTNDHDPRLGLFQAALNAVGYDLAVVPLARK